VKKLSIVAVVGLVVALTPIPASAKGPMVVEATITGPGLKRPVTFSHGTGDGAPSESKRMQLFAEQAGVHQRILFGEDGSVDTREPSGELGPRFTVTWAVAFAGIYRLDPAEFDSSLYPYAEGGPVLYTAETKLDFGERGETGGLFHVDAGWQHGPLALVDNLQAWGIPPLDELITAPPARDRAPARARATAPAAAPGSQIPWLLIGVIAAGSLVAAFARSALRKDPVL
jgi:hypothetical protein